MLNSKNYSTIINLNLLNDSQLKYHKEENVKYRPATLVDPSLKRPPMPEIMLDELIIIDGMKVEVEYINDDKLIMLRDWEIVLG
jgi:hypothetical protein